MATIRGSYFFWSWQMPPAILEESWIQLWTLSSYSDGNEKLSFGGADSAGPVKKGDSSQLWWSPSTAAAAAATKSILSLRGSPASACEPAPAQGPAGTRSHLQNLLFWKRHNQPMQHKYVDMSHPILHTRLAAYRMVINIVAIGLVWIQPKSVFNTRIWFMCERVDGFKSGVLEGASIDNSCGFLKSNVSSTALCGCWEERE